MIPLENLKVLRRAVIGLGIAVILLAGLIGFGAYRLLRVTSRQSSDEARTCVIQQKGLPAGHALARVIGDIHEIIGFRPVAKSHAVPLNPEELSVIADLNAQAALYAQLESQQPQSRSC